MTRAEAGKVVSYAWSNGNEHPLLGAALQILNISRSHLQKLRVEMAKVTRGHCRLTVLTPSGGSVRR